MCTVLFIMFYIFTYYIDATLLHYIQLYCPSVTHCDYVITFSVKVRFQIRDNFWILIFFCEISKHACLTSCRVLVFSRGG